MQNIEEVIASSGMEAESLSTVEMLQVQNNVDEIFEKDAPNTGFIWDDLTKKRAMGIVQCLLVITMLSSLMLVTPANRFWPVSILIAYLVVTSVRDCIREKQYGFFLESTSAAGLIKRKIILLSILVLLCLSDIENNQLVFIALIAAGGVLLDVVLDVVI